jgi:uncharacterized protein (DUF1015 family)
MQRLLILFGMIDERRFMATIAPFKGIHYNTNIAGKLENLISPPYDVITPVQQANLYAKSDKNFVRIILNRPKSPDEPIEAIHGRASALFRSWLQEGILEEDADECFYIYEQQFINPANGERLSRIGLFCALKLEPYSAGVVLPHEETRKKAKLDRLLLMRASSANTEPIFGLYEDLENMIRGMIRKTYENSVPSLAAEVNGETHRVWRMNEKSSIAAIADVLKDRRIWIADGHHRYETALNYRDEIRTANPDLTQNHPCDYILIILSAFNDPGLVTLPTHRLVRNIASARMSSFIPSLSKWFDVRDATESDLKELSASASGLHRFGLVLKDGCFFFQLKEGVSVTELIQSHAEVWKRLDVSILQELVLGGMLGFPADTLAITPDISYSREVEEVLRSVQIGEFDAGFILSMPSAEDVRLIASAGEKMPPKSTFFFPKQWSGLLMRRL